MSLRGGTSLCLLVTTCIIGIHAGTYLVTAPTKYIRGSNYDVLVDILGNATQGRPVEVAASIQGLVYNRTTRRNDVIQHVVVDATVIPGLTSTLSLPIDTNLTCQNCQLRVRGTGGLQIDASMSVRGNLDIVSILVQTDKAIYKPSQIVRYRAVAVYPNLAIYNGRFIVKILDPRNNVIQFRQNVVSDDGVIDGTLTLSDQPMFGEWKVQVSLEGILDKTSQVFTVADYELPRFEVTVELPPYGLVRDTVLTGKVKAKYTFGQPVQGMVELHLGPSRGPDYCGNLPQTTQIAFEIDGEADFEVPKSDFSRAIGYIGDGTEVKVTAFVKEDATGVRLNGSSVVKLYTNQFNIKFLDNTPDVFKPGLQYTAFIQVTTPDGMPPTQVVNTPSVTTPDGMPPFPTLAVPRLVSVYTTATYKTTRPDQSLYNTHEFRGTYPLPGQNLTLPANGILPVDIDIPSNATEIAIKTTFGDVSATQTVKNAYSPGNTFLQLILQERNVQANTNVSFLLKGTEALGQLTFTVLARGSIVRTGMLDGEGQKEFTFDLLVNPSMAPTAHMIVFYTKDGNELIADSLAFNVDGLFANEVSVSFSTNQSEPASDISLEVTAEASSTVCVLAVDQSVLLLKTGNDITAEKVSDEVSIFDDSKKPSDSEFPLSYSSTTSQDAFSSVGLMLLTDVQLYRPPVERVNRFRGGYDGPYYSRHHSMPGLAGQPGPPGPPAFSPETDSLSNRQVAVDLAPLAEVERVRNVFPEAWLWTRGVAGPDGSVSFQTSVPDTITSWVASAFAVHSSAGLGVAPTTTKLRVFRPFFVSLTFPSKAVRGEKVVVQATVFNYLGTDANVRVTMKASDSYSNLRLDAEGTETVLEEDVVFDIQVASDDQGVVYFPIHLTQIGVAYLEVIAQTASAADGVRRSIYVQSEGAAASYNVPIFVRNEGTSDTFTDTVTLSLPPSAVEGSSNKRVKVTGDLIGASLDSLTSLLSLPTGCGEQSMVKFAPDLYIYRYLQATGQLSRAYRERIKALLESGYQRQLTYQRHDGGFSAFGNRDSASSTWLTAFVLRTFVQARNVIFIDEGMLHRGVTWLINHMDNDGGFQEFGTILDRTIQATSNRESLTAYVLLALVESRGLYKNFQLRHCENLTPRSRRPDFQATCQYVNTTRLVQWYLENHVDSVEDQLSLAVISLALSRAGSQRAQAVFARLQTSVREAGALSFWADNTTTPTGRPSRKGSAFYTFWQPPSVQAQPLDILITSYAILTYVQLDQQDQALAAVTWLAKQRNDRGGFVSTQDTILALEALSKYASSLTRPDTTLNVKVTPEGAENDIEFSVSRANALSLQIQQLPQQASETHGVSLEVTGTGIVLVEFDVRFFVDAELSTPSFDVNTVLLDDNIDHFNLMVCTKWLWDRPTGMVVQEVSIPSGFEADLQSTGNVAGMKKAERKGNVVEIYFDEITKTSLCYSIIMARTAKVAQTQKNYVRTYDYYKPADQSTVFYQPVSLRDSTVCDLCAVCCA